MNEFMESEAFGAGVAVGVKIQQQKIVMAQKHHEPIKIDGELYYVQSGRERLKEVIDKACR